MRGIGGGLGCRRCLGLATFLIGFWMCDENVLILKSLDSCAINKVRHVPASSRSILCSNLFFILFLFLAKIGQMFQVHKMDEKCDF